ncbi:nitrate reductase cytochrome c-type subunit [Bradyrhizobium sp. 62B]|jgi:cytochrome c-type protein NapB|uniref:nitrate reductase cytochrome c-type subunit n=1 Tax=Bradyrhizobium TaxID=374 RepID=UPI00188915EF|nr:MULTISPECIES: nitrate reductase cytochrome c-type subunit [Bradyrhizobium]WIW45461.1 nitrate reductase cytochrome c-type subunit [Bradyrhizobium sp. 62B]MBR0699653.1 nitrate reductase cytochrome c-type subunit [Bradyrhizobium diazoefficiens]MBR0767988.1 nitrate reductase cytochrome c-type subunit [Bradyrhizobium diazoefficiens]MBR0928441.1 nitrate reductase cytochrome c-type subunit [Bradyrhizobium diazoefficiens]MCS3762520.1 cytochrome c-type protein NapB [Bradyrhizobium centrosematis]
MTFVRLIPLIAVAAVTVALAIPFAASGPLAQEAKPVKALREAPLTEMSAPPDVTKQSVPASGFERAYRQQPPLIPHKVDGYQITTQNNACMGCHDWPGNTRVNAPKISETHYVDRQGVRLDKVAGTRYFCQQCHVPQADAKPLVGNIFQNATQAK